MCSAPEDVDSVVQPLSFACGATRERMQEMEYDPATIHRDKSQASSDGDKSVYVFLSLTSSVKVRVKLSHVSHLHFVHKHRLCFPVFPHSHFI